MMSKGRQIKLLMDCARLLADNKVSNESSFMKWWGIVKYCHSRGYLYTGFDSHGEIDLTAIAYRVSEAVPMTGNDIPESEDGEVLYVLACASITENKHKLRRLMLWYLRENPDVTSIAYHKRNSEELVYHELRSRYGQEKIT